MSHAWAIQTIADQLIRPNDEKLFYRLLYDYREAQMENYNPGVPPSTSDFHHLRPPNWGKRISTCQFTQSGKNGHTRNVSRFTVISNVAETEAGTVKSYDPYNASRVLQPCDSQVSHAKIIVHRNSPEPSVQAEAGGVVSHSYRSYKSTTGSLQQKKKRASSQRPGTAGQLLSPPGTMSSIQSSRAGGTPRVRPNSRHKRGVDFSGLRKRPDETPRRSSDRSRKAPASIVGGNTTYGRDNISRSSPQKKSRRGTTAAKNMAKVTDARDDSVIWNEELKQLGHKIAEHCDEAFRSSLISSASSEALDCQRESTPLSFTLESPTTPPPRPTFHHWDSRPLPPIPYADAQSPDRRIVSAPVYSQYSRNAKKLPSIYENTPESRAQVDTGKGRTVSAPVDSTAPLLTRHENRGLEYLARVENTIRVVTSPTGAKTYPPGEAPEPLNLRKKYPRAVPELQASNGRCSRLDMREPFPPNGHQDSHRDDTRTPSQGSEPFGGIKKKTSSWFKRSSKGSANDASFTSEKTAGSKEAGKPIDASHGNRSSSQSTAETAGPLGAKKKGFNLSFWKTGRNEPKMSLAGEMQRWSLKTNTVRTNLRPGPAFHDASGPESEDRPKTQASRPGASPGMLSSGWFDNDSGGRKIEIRQNWLARFFRVKPATRYLCFTISRRRARQEIAILLKDWRKYGMTDIDVDKARDTVFARVSPDNCELYFSLQSPGPSDAGQLC